MHEIEMILPFARDLSRANLVEKMMALRPVKAREPQNKPAIAREPRARQRLRRAKNFSSLAAAGHRGFVHAHPAALRIHGSAARVDEGPDAGSCPRPRE